MTATNTTSRSRRGTVTAAAVTEPCALIVTEGVLAVVVGERDGLRSVAATDELNVDTLVGTAKQKKHEIIIVTFFKQEHVVMCVTWN